MARLSQALLSSFIEERGGARVYSGNVDGLWTVIAVPQGGYALGLIVKSCLESQSTTSHPEIVHVTGHFLRTTSMDKFQVHVRTLRTGKFYSNLTADLYQKGEVKITAQLIFKAPSVGQQDPRLTLSPPSPYARKIPLHLHPSVALVTPMFSYATFKTHVRWAEDKAIRERNIAIGRGEGPPLGDNILEWGTWLEFLDPDEVLDASMLSFVADVIRNTPELVPKSQRPPNTWFPTMVLALEYKSKIPDDPAFSKRTVGLYSCGRFMNEGRHDIYVEIWTAPSNIGEGIEVEGWREKMVCLGISHQMALSVPSSVNERKAAAVRSTGKL